MLKRSMDIVLSVLALIGLSPFLIGIAILVKRDGGPIFYSGERAGLHEKPFRMHKFRSMVVNAAALGPTSTASDDPRITRVGHFLRKTKLDELPQFYNVLKGDMSIVGPRPQIGWAVAEYDEEEKTILNVKPGITDWAALQVSDEGARLRGSSDPDADYLRYIWPEKRHLQLAYVADHSFWIDIKIILLTAKALTIDLVLKR